MNSAELCRVNGWSAGTVLEGTESGTGWSTTSRIRITAVGERIILAKKLWQDGVAVEHPDESCWTLECRDWKPVKEDA